MLGRTGCRRSNLIMKRIVPTALMRWLLAIIVLATAAATPMRIGHAHGGAGHHDHQHLAEVHQDDHHPNDPWDAHHDVPALGDRIFHWHDSWLGISFVTTPPTEGRGQGPTFESAWLDPAILASAGQSGCARPVHDWLPPPGFLGLTWDWVVPQVVPFTTSLRHAPAVPIPWVGSVQIRC